MGIDVIGVESQGFPITGLSLIESTQIGQGQPQVVVRLGHWTQADSLLQKEGRFRRTAQIDERQAQIVVNLSVCRPKLQGAMEKRHGLFTLPLADQHVAQVVVGFSIIGLKGERSPQTGDRLVELPQLGQGHAQIVVTLGEVGPLAHDVEQFGHGFRQLPHTSQSHAQAGPSGDMAWLKLKGLPITFRCLLKPSLSLQCFSQKIQGLRIVAIRLDRLPVGPLRFG